MCNKKDQGRSLKFVTWMLPVLLLVTTNVQAEDRIAALEQQLQVIAAEIEQLKRLQPKSTPEHIPVGVGNSLADESTALVDLNTYDLGSFDGAAEHHVLSSPWWRNIEITGFGAAGFYDTGSAGTRDHGGFEIKEASLFIDAEIWENINFFIEFQTNRLGFDSDRFTRTGEVHVHARDILPFTDEPIGFKAGRIDLPFGEEYLWQDAIDNPLITNSAAYVYGTDEGILLYSSIKGIHWIASLTDGLLKRSTEENSDKAFTLKVYGNPTESLYLSASYMNNGASSLSAMQFAGSFIQPVGGWHQSSLGKSPSSEVDARLYAVDGKYSFHGDSYNGYIALSAGTATVNDKDSLYDRDFSWFAVEPLVYFGNTYYLALRYSEIGTYKDSEGYHFDGKNFAGGNRAFGYDTKRLQRLGVGFGWTPNPRLKAKFEVGKDWFKLIDASPIETNNDNRVFAAFEIAVKI